MSLLLTADQLARYRRDGILFPVPVLTPAELARFRAGFDEWQARLGGTLTKEFFHQTHLHLRFAYDLVTHPRILDAVEDVLGPDVLVWSSSVFAKEPHTPSYISWHQDGTYWNLDSTEV